MNFYNYFAQWNKYVNQWLEIANEKLDNDTLLKSAISIRNKEIKEMNKNEK